MKSLSPPPTNRTEGGVEGTTLTHLPSFHTRRSSDLILFNCKSVNIPSYQLKPGDSVSMKEGSRANPVYSKWWEQTHQSSVFPSWLESNALTWSGTVKSW